jgi:hypothetical protein
VTIYEKKTGTSVWTAKTLLILWGMGLLFILLLCLIGAWWTK